MHADIVQLPILCSGGKPWLDYCDGLPTVIVALAALFTFMALIWVVNGLLYLRRNRTVLPVQKSALSDKPVSDDVIGEYIRKSGVYDSLIAHNRENLHRLIHIRPLSVECALSGDNPYIDLGFEVFNLSAFHIAIKSIDKGRVVIGGEEQHQGPEICKPTGYIQPGDILTNGRRLVIRQHIFINVANKVVALSASRAEGKGVPHFGMSQVYLAVNSELPDRKPGPNIALALPEVEIPPNLIMP